MKKYIYPAIIVFVLLIALTLSFGNAKVDTDHYENGEISFDYPATWKKLPVDGTVKGHPVAVFKDPESGLKVTISRQTKPPKYETPTNFFPTELNASQSTLKLVSQKVIDLNGTQAYDNLYKIKGNDTSIEQRELWLDANGALYSIIYQYPQGSVSQGDSSYDLGTIFKNLYNSINPNSANNAAFDTMKNSLKISPTELKNQAVFGSISIPSQGIKWDIRYDTINIANGVYRYPESFYPGENGTVGIQGHHTRFSAPFANINLLQVGDEVIINDFLTQKKYTYKVTSNGDINWDYKVKPVQFPAGKSELTLVTCWPPGYMQAAYCVHCELVSIEPIK